MFYYILVSSLAHNGRLPISVMDIIQLPMDEFNDLLSKHELTEEQLTLCRDIRRRGKNKVSKILCSAHKTCKYLNTKLKSRFKQLIIKRITLGGCPKLQKTKDRPNQTTGRRCWKNPKSKGRISSGT